MNGSELPKGRQETYSHDAELSQSNVKPDAMRNLALPIIIATLICGGVAHAGVYSHRYHLNHGKSASVAVKSAYVPAGTAAASD
jgi:hypothetical protein